jgi:hypothetical protein
MEVLESVGPRPRQARYQAALRPDRKYAEIIKDFPTELLLHLISPPTVPKLGADAGEGRGKPVGGRNDLVLSRPVSTSRDINADCSLHLC